MSETDFNYLKVIMINCTILSYVYNICKGYKYKGLYIDYRDQIPDTSGNVLIDGYIHT